MKSQYKQANDLRNQSDKLPFDEEVSRQCTYGYYKDDIQVIINGHRYNLS